MSNELGWILTYLWIGFCSGCAFMFWLVLTVIKATTDAFEPEYYWFPSKKEQRQ